MKIFLIGWFGAGNRGDEAILVQELLFFSAHVKDPEFFILSFDPETTKRTTAGIPGIAKILRVGSKSRVLRSDFGGILGAFGESDLVVIGGGGIFQDLYNFYPIPFFTAMALMARLRRKPLVLYCVGIGPVKGSWGRKMCRHAAETADFVSVRDKESAVLLRELGVSGEIHLAADPVFLLEPDSSARAEKAIREMTGDGRGPVIGVCVQDLLAWDTRNRMALAEALDTLARERGARIVFVPMGIYRDRWFGRGKREDPVDVAASNRVAALMKVPGAMVPDELTPRELLAVIRRMDLMVSMRLHGVIMPLGVGVPVVALTYAEETKVGNLMKRLGQEERLFDVRNLSARELLAVMNGLLSGAGPARREIFEEVAALKRQAGQCNDRLLERIAGRAPWEKWRENVIPL